MGNLNVYLISFFGGLFALFISFGGILERKKSIEAFLLSFLLLSISIVQLQLGLYLSGHYIEYIILNLGYIPFAYCIGPLMYFLCMFFTNHDYKFKPRFYLNFLPGILFALILIPFYYGKIHIVSYVEIYRLITFIIATSVIIYLGLFFKRNHYISFFKKFSSIGGRIPLIPLLIIFLCFLISLYYFAFIVTYITLDLGNDFFTNNVVCISVMIIALTLLIYLFERRYQGDYYVLLRKKALCVKAEDSRMKSLDVDAVLNHLHALMVEEQAFADEDITIERLSSEISITKHQLSNILNKRVGKNFYTYINEYRINESKTLLVEEPDRSVLSISIAVGFNSKSSFYTTFLKHTGLKPIQYRKKMLRGSERSKQRKFQNVSFMSSVG